MQRSMKNPSGTPNTWKNELVIELILLYLKVLQFSQTLPLLCRIKTMSATQLQKWRTNLKPSCLDDVNYTLNGTIHVH